MIFCCLHTILIFANFPVRSQGQKNVLISLFWYFLSCFCPIAINYIGLINFGVYHTELSKSRWQVTDAKEYVLLLLESIFNVTRKSCSICFKNAFSLVIDDFFVVYIKSWSLQTFQYVVKGKQKCAHLLILIYSGLIILSCYYCECQNRVDK